MCRMMRITEGRKEGRKEGREVVMKEIKKR